MTRRIFDCVTMLKTSTSMIVVSSAIFGMADAFFSFAVLFNTSVGSAVKLLILYGVAVSLGGGLLLSFSFYFFAAWIVSSAFTFISIAFLFGMADFESLYAFHPFWIHLFAPAFACLCCVCFTQSPKRNPEKRPSPKRSPKRGQRPFPKP